MCHVDSDGTVGAARLQWDGVVRKHKVSAFHVLARK